MKLKFFKYMPAKYALATLRSGMIKVSTAADANDPNEIMPWITSNGRDNDIDEIQKSARFWLAEELGFISLSTNWDSNPMWGLYADKFRGMALVFGYDLSEPGHEMFPVRYSAWRYHITDDELDAQRNGGDPYGRMRELYANKDKTWAFESEWRRIVKIEDTKPLKLENGETGYFVDVGKYLTGAIIGPNSTVTLGDVENAMREHPIEDFTVTKLRYDTRSFALTFICKKKWVQGQWMPDTSTVI